jgi:hypothetical protein
LGYTLSRNPLRYSESKPPVEAEMCSMVFFVKLERLPLFIQNRWTKQVLAHLGGIYEFAPYQSKK